MDVREKKRVRSSNFSENEKNHLINIVAKYKSIIENKETDKASNEEKNAACDKIAANFNSTSPESKYRSKECLKRFYENKKKELRKKVADQKIEIKKTGGGPPTQMKLDPFEDVLLSITNKKTIFGLNSLYGGDVSSDGDEENQAENNENILSDSNIANEIIYEFDPVELNLEHNVVETWKKYKPSDLQKPLSSELKRKENVLFQANDQHVETSHMPLTSTDQFTPAPKRKMLQSDRRRPNVQVKALTSSEVSEKYNKLLDIRLEVAEFSKKHLQQQIKNDQEKHEKEMILLDLKILTEKENLNKIKRGVS